MEMIKGVAFKTDWGWIGVLATAHGIAAVTLPCRNRQAAEEQLRKARPFPIHFAQRGGGDRHVQAAKSAKVKQLDYVLITHYHRDHVGGVPQLADRMKIGAFQAWPRGVAGTGVGFGHAADACARFRMLPCGQSMTV